VTRTAQLHALARSWRSQAAEIEGPDEDGEEPIDLSEDEQQEAATLLRCADELEAAIRGRS
jgi:hypothetical protein